MLEIKPIEKAPELDEEAKETVNLETGQSNFSAQPQIAKWLSDDVMAAINV